MLRRALLVAALSLAALPAPSHAATPNCIVVGGASGDADLRLDVAHIHKLATALRVTALPRQGGFRNGAELAALVQRARRAGCRAITLFVATHGSSTGDDFSTPGASCPADPEPTLYPGGRDDRLPASELRNVLAANPSVRFNLIIEACYADQFFQAVAQDPRPPNLGHVVTSTGDDAVSHGSAKGSPFVTGMIDGFRHEYAKRGNRGRAGRTLTGAIKAAWKWQRDHDSTGQRSILHVSGEIVPRNDGRQICSSNEAALGLCEYPTALLRRLAELDVTFAFDGTKGHSLRIDPVGKTITNPEEWEIAWKPPFHDVFYYVAPGMSVTVTATPGPGYYLDGFASVAGLGEQCVNDGSLPRRTCGPITVTRPGPVFQIVVLPIFYECPKNLPPGSEPPPDCAGGSGAA